MNGKLRFSMGILKSIIVFTGIFFLTLQGFAGGTNFYHWKDDQGKNHITDNPLKIPLKYRTKANVKKMRTFPTPKSSSVRPSAPGGEKEKEAAVEDPAKPDEKDDEQVAMQAALDFLKSDIQRYEKYQDYVPQQRHAILLRNDIVAVLPQKEGLEKKLEKYDTPIFKDIRGFLKKSLQKDYEVKAREYPRRQAFITERTRIQEESSEKTRLVKILESKISSLPGKAPASTKPTDTGSNNSEVTKQDSKRQVGGPAYTKKY